MKKPITYICHPYGNDPRRNLRKIRTIYKQLTIKGDVIPFVPYYATVSSLDDGNPTQRAKGFEHNKVFFERRLIDKMMVFGEISAGMKIEIDWCEEFGIPVIYGFDTEKAKQSVYEIIADICNALKITHKEFTSPSRKGELVIARIIATNFIIKNVNVSLEQVGSLMGGRDHSTVVYYKNQYRDLTETKDPELLRKIEQYEDYADAKIYS